MTLPFPYPVYGYIQDSNGELISGAMVMLEDTSPSSSTSDSSGKYVINIQNIAGIGNTLTIKAEYYGEKYDDSWVVSVTAPAKRLDIKLKEARYVGPIAINSSRNVNNSLYILGTNSQYSWLKTIEYD